MGAKTGIEWTRTLQPDGTYTEGATWNPLIAYNEETGRRGWFCIHAGDDCKNPDGESGCYAESINVGDIRIAGAQIGNGLHYIAANIDKVRFELVNLHLPHRWRRHPRKIFVESMADLFLPIKRDRQLLITYEMQREVFEQMRVENMHTYQLLTKHSGALVEFVTRYRRELGLSSKRFAEMFRHVHVCVSAGGQKELLKRGPALLLAPFEVRLLSLEPLIRGVDLSVIGTWPYTTGPQTRWGNDKYKRRIQGILLGGESYKPNPRAARPMHIRWARDVRDFCEAHGISFFFKQWGEYAPLSALSGKHQRDALRGAQDGHVQALLVAPDGRTCSTDEKQLPGAITMYCMGKRRSGRTLDGREHNDYPELPPV